MEDKGYNYGENQKNEQAAEEGVERSSYAFSVMCAFLAVLYAGFAALVYAYSDEILAENRADARNEALSPSDPDPTPGYIGGERFGVVTTNPGIRPGDVGGERGFIRANQGSHSGSMG